MHRLNQTRLLAGAALAALGLAGCGASTPTHPVVGGEPLPSYQIEHDPWFGIPADCRGLDPAGHKVAVTCRTPDSETSPNDSGTVVKYDSPGLVVYTQFDTNAAARNAAANDPVPGDVATVISQVPAGQVLVCSLPAINGEPASTTWTAPATANTVAPWCQLPRVVSQGSTPAPAGLCYSYDHIPGPPYVVNLWFSWPITTNGVETCPAGSYGPVQLPSIVSR